MADKRKSPVKGRIARVPMIMQLEALECGAASLAMIMAYYDKWVPIEQVRIDCGVSRDGSNAKNIILAARNYGFAARGLRYDTAALRKNGVFPCVIHWEFNHFLVLCGFKGRYAYINDPAGGQMKIPVEEFDKSFTGIVLEIVPGKNFVPGGKRKSVLAFAKKRLKGAGAAVAFVSLTGIITYVFGIIDPVMAQVFMDRLLSHRDPQWLVPFIGIMSGLAVLQLIALWVSAFYSLKINGKMAIVGSASYIWKVLNLPLEFFSQRMAGDIMMRQENNESIAETLVNTVAPLLLNSFMMGFYLIVMLRQSLLLTAIGVLSIAVNLFVSRIISDKRMNIARVKARDAGSLAGASINGIRMIETIQSSGAENGFFRKWAGYQAAVNSQTVKFNRISEYYGMIPELISTLASYSVLVIGVYLTMNGRFTQGMIMSFQSFLAAFMRPAKLTVSAGQTIQEMRTDMEMVDDIMEYPDDPYAADDTLKDDVDYAKLSGNVEIRNVTFGYSRLAPPVISDFSLSVKKGSRVAIVGSSGCGKSTISKLISGLYRPWQGEILFDGKDISSIDRSVFTGSVAVVDQDIILFEDTIAANIKMWDDTIEDFEMILAARDAQIHDDIMHRQGGYQYRLTEGGKDLSGGQRQRLEIARVLAQDPSVVILDEATSALDARTEFDVVNAIKDRGITCIIITHRLSAIRDCDDIIVLDGGKIVERGTHDELYPLGGIYTELVTNE
ncbi:MAG: NHLP family bacteriocin export ABC transporter peptidase/permease/ATPase subunit [Oscillospiraceae bacterium]|nr:NHLP family bacteriocin export ABC transporter peptidase/permease/ATPase subunit [Oscillospiraceae bacterium]